MEYVFTIAKWPFIFLAVFWVNWLLWFLFIDYGHVVPDKEKVIVLKDEKGKASRLGMLRRFRQVLGIVLFIIVDSLFVWGILYQLPPIVRQAVGIDMPDAERIIQEELSENSRRHSKEKERWNIDTGLKRLNQ